MVASSQGASPLPPKEEHCEKANVQTNLATALNRTPSGHDDLSIGPLISAIRAEALLSAPDDFFSPSASRSRPIYLGELTTCCAPPVVLVLPEGSIGKVWTND